MKRIGDWIVLGERKDGSMCLIHKDHTKAARRALARASYRGKKKPKQEPDFSTEDFSA